MAETLTITITVYGNPAPQGSKTYKGTTTTGRAILVESSKRLKPWRTLVNAAARQQMRNQPPNAGPIAITIEFVLPRPKNLPKTKPTPPATKRPDLDKLDRGILDSLSGVCFHDDSQVTKIESTKRTAEHGEQPGATITIHTAYCSRCGIPHTTPCKRGDQ